MVRRFAPWAWLPALLYSTVALGAPLHLHHAAPPAHAAPARLSLARPAHALFGRTRRDPGAPAPAGEGIPVERVKYLKNPTFITPKVLPLPTYRVSDGDTLVVPRFRYGTFQVIVDHQGPAQPILFHRSNVGLRFLGDDAPEVHVPDGHGHMLGQGEPGEFATQYLAHLLAGADRVEIEPLKSQPIDKYGRVLGDIYAWKKENGRDVRIDVNRQLIKDGVVDIYEIYRPGFDLARFNDLSRLSGAAIHDKLGIYGPAHFLAERPNCFRAQVQGRPHERYLADMKRHVVFPPGHQYEQYVPIENRVWIDPDNLGAARSELGLRDAPSTTRPLLFSRD